MNPTTMIALRVMDLRGEFEAQLRAVTRLEVQLRNTTNPATEDLAEALRRELAEMLANNSKLSIRATRSASQTSKADNKRALALRGYRQAATVVPR
jgi:hypothetical protein